MYSESRQLVVISSRKCSVARRSRSLMGAGARLPSEPIKVTSVEVRSRRPAAASPWVATRFDDGSASPVSLLYEALAGVQSEDPHHDRRPRTDQSVVHRRRRRRAAAAAGEPAVNGSSLGPPARRPS